MRDLLIELKRRYFKSPWIIEVVMRQSFVQGLSILRITKDDFMVATASLHIVWVGLEVHRQVDTLSFNANGEKLFERVRRVHQTQSFFSCHRSERAWKIGHNHG